MASMVPKPPGLKRCVRYIEYPEFAQEQLGPLYRQGPFSFPPLLIKVSHISPSLLTL